MSGDAVAEILDVEGALKSGSKKATKWSDKRRKNGHDEYMEVVGRIWERRDVSPELQGTNFSDQNEDRGRGRDTLDRTGRP